MSLLDGTQV